MAEDGAGGVDAGGMRILLSKHPQSVGEAVFCDAFDGGDFFRSCY